MKELTIVWDRVGRSRNVAPFRAQFDPKDEQSLEALIDMLDRFIGRHLSSRFYDWTLDYEAGGPVVIDGGRFGGGTATVVDVP